MVVWCILLLLLPAAAAEDCSALLADARDLLQRRQYATAASRLELAPGACGSDEGVLLELARAQLLAQQFEKSLDAVRRLLLIDPNSVPGLRVKAEAHYLLGEDSEAEAALKKALSIEPKNEEAHYSLGRIYYQEQRYLLARDQFEKVIELNPKSYKGWDNLGLAQEGLTQTTLATKSYLKAIELVYKAQPHYDWPYANLANLLLNEGEYRKAFDLAVTASERNPESSRNFYLTAKALTKLDHWEKSLRWLERSIQLDSGYPEPHYLLAQVYRKLDRQEDSQREFRKFKELRDKAPNRQR